MRWPFPIIILALGFASPVQARDLFEVMAEPAAKSWQTSSPPNLKFCIVASVAARTGQASTVVDNDGDTMVIVHNWTSPVPGDDVRAIFTIKPSGSVELRGQKLDLAREIERCVR